MFFCKKSVPKGSNIYDSGVAGDGFEFAIMGQSKVLQLLFKNGRDPLPHKLCQQLLHLLLYCWRLWATLWHNLGGDFLCGFGGSIFGHRTRGKGARKRITGVLRRGWGGEP